MAHEKLAEEALALPLVERVELAQALWESLDEERPEDAAAEDEREVLERARRRDSELTTGAVRGRSHQEVMEAARRNLR
jgi:hypothetical protein